jgi:hypothetical protein
MEPEGSLPHSQVPATCPYPEPHHPIHAPTSHFLKIHHNIILPSMPGSPKLSLSFRFPHQNPIYAPPLNHTRHMPRPSPAKCWVNSTAYKTRKVFINTRIFESGFRVKSSARLKADSATEWCRMLRAGVRGGEGKGGGTEGLVKKEVIVFCTYLHTALLPRQSTLTHEAISTLQRIQSP